MFYDLGLFQESGRALWAGEYIGLYPLPASAVFWLFSLIPLQLAGILLGVLGVSGLIPRFRWQTPLWALYYPVLSNLLLGQVDLLIFWLIQHGSPVSLALATLKPQLGVLVIPSLLMDRKKIKPFLGWMGVLYGIPTLCRPGWLLEWLGRVNDGRLEIGMPAWMGIFLFILLMGSGRMTWRALFWGFNPSFRVYDYLFLIGGGLWKVPASWLALGWAWEIQTAWPFGLLAIVEALIDGKRDFGRQTSSDLVGSLGGHAQAWGRAARRLGFVPEERDRRMAAAVGHEIRRSLR